MTSRPSKERPREFQVQLNTRIPLSLRQRLEEHLDALYVLSDKGRLGKLERDWPQTLTGVVEQALENYLASHVPVDRPGPDSQADKPLPKLKPRIDKHDHDYPEEFKKP